MAKSMTRRSFIGGVSTASVAFSIVPRHVLGGVGYKAPSDTVNIAGIGVGGKGYWDITGCASENIVALCDIDEKRGNDSFEQFPKAKRYKDFRRMLEEMPEIDAVTVSTPDHTHALIAITAMKMGKHVYCQKPLTRTIHESRMVAETARETGVVTQMGNQGHAFDGTRLMREIVEAGIIGDIQNIEMWTNRPIWPQALERPTEAHNVPPWVEWDLWLGPAPFRPYHPAYHPFAWRGWWDFGTGALGDIACHMMDASFWIFDLKNPTRVQAETTPVLSETAPLCSRITYEFDANNTRGPITIVWRDGGLKPPKPSLIDTEESILDEANGQMIIGSDGILSADMYGNNPRLYPHALHQEVMANPPAEKYARIQADSDLKPYIEWINAIKEGAQPGSNFPDHAAPLTELTLLGNLAIRTGEIIEWDADAMRVTSSQAANQLLKQPYRDGWAW